MKRAWGLEDTVDNEPTGSSWDQAAWEADGWGDWDETANAWWTGDDGVISTRIEFLDGIDLDQGQWVWSVCHQLERCLETNLGGDTIALFIDDLDLLWGQLLGAPAVPQGAMFPQRQTSLVRM